MHSSTLQTKPTMARRLQGFTLVELLVVLAVVGILASLLLPVLAKVKERGRQAGCISNLHQMALGFTLYHEASHDQFPAPGSKTKYGPQPEDWIWWQYGRGVTNSSIAPYVSGFNPRIFTCPSDREALDLQAKGELPGSPYRYSYSLTSYDLKGTVNPGMATIITKNREIFPFRITSVLRPTVKIMLVEEERATIDDPRWVPNENFIAARHGIKGNVVFADSHIESVLRQHGTNQANSLPGK